MHQQSEFGDPSYRRTGREHSSLLQKNRSRAQLAPTEEQVASTACSYRMLDKFRDAAIIFWTVDLVGIRRSFLQRYQNMSSEKWSTLQTEHIQHLAETLARRELSAIVQLEPIADFEELLTFDEAQPTPIEFTPHSPAWRLESVAVRVIEAVAIAAHERLTALGYRELARILSAHAEYLYTYPVGEPRPRLEAGSALALAGCVCATLPQSELWRLAGFGRISAVLAEAAPVPTDSHLTGPIDVAFWLANERNLPILDAAVTAYNAVLKRNFTPQHQYNLPFSDSDFFDALNLDFPGMEAVKASVLVEDIVTAKSAYTAFRSEFLNDFLGGVRNPNAALLEKSDTYTTAKTYLECLLRLSIYPTPAITATTEIGIAAHLFPEFGGCDQLCMLALRRYKWIVAAFFHADGFHKDRTLRSHVEAIADFVRFLSVYEGAAERAYYVADGDPAERAGYLEASLERQVETCLRLRQPDNAFPPLGPLPAPNFDAVELCTLVDCEDFSSTDITSHGLPETGCYVMRDSWEPDAHYLFFDAQPSRELSSTGTSTLVLHAHGRHLTTCSVGVLETTLSEPDARNTRWITTPAFDFVEKWDVLTAHLDNTKTVRETTEVHHKLAIFYLKGEYFVLHDLVLGVGAYTLEHVFHLGRGATSHIAPDTGSIWTQYPHPGNLFIGAPDMTDLAITLDDGSVIYQKCQESPLAVNTVLLPMKPEVKGVPTLSTLEVLADADVLGTGFTLQSSKATDTFLISDDGLAEMSTADIRVVGEFLCLQRDASGAIVQFVMLNGRFLEVDGSVLVDLEEPRESYVLSIV